jgi:uncharacterized protein (UPF0548 family)
MAVGTPVGVRAYHCGFWSLNPARIVYLVEEMGDVKRFGFGYGTLPGHAERGEERFRVEWNREDGCVYYDAFAFSRPKHPLAWLGYPFARALQPRTTEMFRSGLEEGDARRSERVEPERGYRQNC